MYKKYKEIDPPETIRRIQRIFNVNGIFYSIDCYSPNSPTNWSLRVHHSNTDKVGANGKGTSYEYALASGMAEFMERLQAGFLSKIEYIDEDNLNRYNFIKFPDEKELPKRKIDIYKLGNFSEDEVRYLGNLLEKKVLCESFYSVNKDKIEYLPDKALRYLCGTNGLASGNTPEEALVQGFSEISERYCLFKIMKEQLTPPEIELSYIEDKYPESYQLIQNLNEYTKKRYSFRFYDLSLGRKFPVVGMVLIDNQTREYKFIAGSHPSFSVALERCLTESCQGLDLIRTSSRNNGFNKDFTYKDEEENIHQRYLQFTLGSGKMPRKFFNEEKSWEFQPWDYSGENKTNKDFVKLFLDLFSFAEDIYIKDLGFLGFNTYQIFIPDVNAKYFDWTEWSKYSIKGVDENIKEAYNELYNICKESLASRRFYKSSLSIRDYLR